MRERGTYFYQAARPCLLCVYFQKHSGCCSAHGHAFPSSPRQEGMLQCNRTSHLWHCGCSCWRHPVLRILSSTPNHYPLDASTTPPKSSCVNKKYLQTLPSVPQEVKKSHQLRTTLLQSIRIICHPIFLPHPFPQHTNFHGMHRVLSLLLVSQFNQPHPSK